MIIEAVFCLALNTYHEAKNQSLVGQIAVAQVVMNRVKDSRYPNNVCDVVKQGLTYKWNPKIPIRNQCQFSWYCDGRGDEPREGRLWTQAQELAKHIFLYKDKYVDITDGATHYHAKYIDDPRWARADRRTATIDQHHFFRL